MSDMPERIWVDDWVGGTGTWGFTGEDDRLYIRADLVADYEAKIERLRKALDQAIDRSGWFLGHNGHLAKWEFSEDPDDLTEYLCEDSDDVGCEAIVAYLREKEANHGN